MLLAHELTHTIQQSRAEHTGCLQVGSRTHPSEREACLIGEIAACGVKAPDVQVSEAALTVRRGEPGVHRDIELRAWGGHNLVNLNKKWGDELDRRHPSPTRLELALETYSGNWMRDFSQVYVPFVKKLLKESFDMEPSMAEKLLGSLLKALATIEFGDNISRHITIDNLKSYLPEEHMDNPAGMLRSELLEWRAKAREDWEQFSIPPEGSPRSTGLKGSQVENPGLYAVSPTGLTLHIYNTIEWVKSSFRMAILPTASLRAGQNDAAYMRRMYYGRGLHGIEDYFAHSNYIEVALNIVLNNPTVLKAKESSSTDLPPKLKSVSRSQKYNGEEYFVDTLFWKNPPRKQFDREKSSDSLRWQGRPARQAITTGTFKSFDTKISIAHFVLNLMPKIPKIIDHAIDEWFEWIPDKTTAWEKVEDVWKQIDDQTAKTQNRAWIAVVVLLKGMDEAGAKMPMFQTSWRQAIRDRSPMRDGRPKEAVVQYLKIADDIKTTKEIIEFVKILKEKDIKSWVKKQVLIILIKLLNTLTGGLLDNLLKKLDDAVFEKANSVIQEEAEKVILEKFAPQTPLEVLVKTDDALRGMWQDKNGEAAKILPDYGWKEQDGVNLYPPSHSEICKDHPPHHESLFFDIHEALAVQAVKHITVLLHDIWSEKCPGTMILEDPNSLVDRAEFDTLNQEASKIARLEQKLAKDLGRNFAQDSESDPRVKSLLNSVDLYISHPSGTEWWHSIFREKLSDRIASDIDNRNKTRKLRGSAPMPNAN